MSTNPSRQGQKQQEAVIVCSDSLDFTDENNEAILKEVKRRRARRAAMAFCHCMNTDSHAKRGSSGIPLLIEPSGRTFKRGQMTYTSSQKRYLEHGDRRFVNKEDDVGSDIENEIPLALTSISDFSKSSWMLPD
ncbi:hypothetical protein GL50803_0028022 [Giardia duodenalis]|uniref:Uncharacterized protein n=1 Tax=Giardia intestinalis (strain ATCC 50803 / WB clone C6) TaxID=184922 RepID=D3KG71_GIAIC|nr:hypothetical protein GL50803_0028022 [Giardia intestinalis]KAE8303719.1 hypothetical protein GL50803_0028022 [Giardia intestinalis]